MKAALFYGGHDIRVEELPDPLPGPREVLVGMADPVDLADCAPTTGMPR